MSDNDREAIDILKKNKKADRSRVTRLSSEFRSTILRDIGFMGFVALGHSIKDLEIDGVKAVNSGTNSQQTRSDGELEKLKKLIESKDKHIFALEQQIFENKRGSPVVKSSKQERISNIPQTSDSRSRSEAMMTKHLNDSVLLESNTGAATRDGLREIEAKIDEFERELKNRLKMMADDVGRIKGELESLEKGLGAGEGSNGGKEGGKEWLRRLDVVREQVYVAKFEQQIGIYLHQVSVLSLRLQCSNRENEQLRIKMEEYGLTDSTLSKNNDGKNIPTLNTAESKPKRSSSLVGSYTKSWNQNSGVSSMKKARVLRYTLLKLSRTHMNFAFYRLFALNSKKIRGKLQASTRVKGRILFAIFNRHATNKSKKKAFIRWLVISKPQLIKHSLSKIAVCSKLTPISALWRFKNLIDKKPQSPMPALCHEDSIKQAAKIIEILILLKSQSNLSKALQKLGLQNPSKVTKCLTLVFSKRSASEVKDLGLSFSKLRSFARSSKLTMKRLKTAMYAKMKLWINRARSKDAGNRVEDLAGTASCLRDAVKRIVEAVVRRNDSREVKLRALEFFGKRNRGLELTRGFIILKDNKRIRVVTEDAKRAATDRLCKAQKWKLQSSFLTLKNQGRQMKLHSELEHEKQSNREKKRYLLIRDRLFAKFHFAWRQLLLHKATEEGSYTLLLAKKSEKHAKTNITLNQLRNAQINKLRQAFNTLSLYSAQTQSSQLFKETRKTAFLRKLSEAFTQKRSAAFDKIVLHSDSEANTSPLRLSLAVLQTRESSNAARLILCIISGIEKSRLAHAFSDLKSEDQASKLESKTVQAERQAAVMQASKLLSDLIKAHRSKATHALKTLSSNADASRLTVVNRSMAAISNLADKRQAISDLINASNIKTRQSLHHLSNHSTHAINQSTASIATVKRCFAMLDIASRCKVDRCMTAMLMCSASMIVERVRRESVARRVVHALGRKVGEAVRVIKEAVRDDRAGSEVKEWRVREALEKLSCRCFTQNRISKELIYFRLKNYTQRHKKEISRLKILLGNLCQRLTSKQTEVFNELRCHNLQTANKSIMNETLMSSLSDKELGQKKKLLKGLLKVQALKSLICMRSLRLMAVQLIDKETKRKTLMDRIVLKCRANVLQRREQSYRKLIAYGRQEKEKENKRKSVSIHAMRKLEATCRDKTHYCFSLLVRWSAISAMASLSRTQSLVKLFAKLKASQEQKEHQALRGLSYNTTVRRRLESERASILTSFEHCLVKKCNEKVQCSLSILKGTAQAEVERDMKLELSRNRLAKILIKAYQLKVDNAMHSLENTRFLVGDLQVERRNFSRNLMMRGLLVKMRILKERAWRKLLDHSTNEHERENRTRDATGTLTRGIVKSLLSKVRSTLRILQANKFHNTLLTEARNLKKRHALHRLHRSQTSKAHQSLARLSASRQASIESEGLRRSTVRLTADRLLQSIVRLLDSRLMQTLRKLKEYGVDGNSGQEKRFSREQRVLGMLRRKMGLKMEEAWGLLGRHCRDIELKKESVQVKKSGLLHALMSSQKVKSKLSLMSLIRAKLEFANLERKRSVMLNSAIKKLLSSQFSKVGQTIRRLLRNVSSETQSEVSKAQKLQIQVQKLISSQSTKLKIAIKVFKTCLADAIDRLRIKQMIRTKAILGMVSAARAKQKHCWVAMGQQALADRQREGRNRSRIQSIFELLGDSQRGKMNKVLTALSMQARASKDKQRDWNLKQKAFICKLIASNKQKTDLAMRKLRAENKNLQSERQSKDRLILTLASQLTNKNRDAFSRLKYSGVLTSALESQRRSAVEVNQLKKLGNMKRALWRLDSAQSRKLGKLFGRLLKLRSGEFKFRDSLIKALFILDKSQRAKVQIGIQAMVKHSIKIQACLDGRRTKMSSLMRALEKACKTKKISCWNYLISNVSKQRIEGLQLLCLLDRMTVKRLGQALEAIRFNSILEDERAQVAYTISLRVQEKNNGSAKLSILLNNLVHSSLKSGWKQVAKQVDKRSQLANLLNRAHVRWLVQRARSFDKLQKWKLYTKGRERSLESIFEKADIRCQSLMRRSFSKLGLNRFNQLCRDAKLDKVLRVGQIRSTMQQLISLTKLQSQNSLVKSQVQSKKRSSMMIKTLFEKNLAKVYFSAIISQLRISSKRKDKNLKFEEVLSQIVERRLREVLRTILSYGRYLQYSNRERVHNKEEGMRALVYLLNKNHNLVKRQYFDTWAAKPRMSDISNILRALVRTRLYQSFSHMRLISNLDKRDRLIKSFNVLELILAKALRQRKRLAMETIKSQFLHYNPWEKRVISTWVFNTTQTLQHSFWRMRYSENVGVGLVSVDKHIRLNRLSTAIVRLSIKHVSKSFDAIVSYADIVSLLETEIDAQSQMRSLQCGETVQFQDLIKMKGKGTGRSGPGGTARLLRAKNGRSEEEEGKRSNGALVSGQKNKLNKRSEHRSLEKSDELSNASGIEVNESQHEDQNSLKLEERRFSSPTKGISVEKSPSILKKPEEMRFANPPKNAEQSPTLDKVSSNSRGSPGLRVTFNDKALSVDNTGKTKHDEQLTVSENTVLHPTLIQPAGPSKQGKSNQSKLKGEAQSARQTQDKKTLVEEQFSLSNEAKPSLKLKPVSSRIGLEQILGNKEGLISQKQTDTPSELPGKPNKTSPNALLRKMSSKTPLVSKFNMTSKPGLMTQESMGESQDVDSATTTKKFIRHARSHTQGDSIPELTPKKSMNSLEEVLFRKK